MSPLSRREDKSALEVVGATTEGESQSRWSGSRNEVPTPCKEQNTMSMSGTTDKALVPAPATPATAGAGDSGKPTGIAVPAWATTVGEWELDVLDGAWMRRLSSAIAVPDSDGQGIELATFQVSDGHAVSSMPVRVAVDIQADSIPNARQLAEWFAAAADVLDEDQA